MNRIQAIDTFYNGNYFRSRLEARWAVYFDLIHEPYEYEPEGLLFKHRFPYLPDFYLPKKSLYCEIKAEEERQAQQEKLKQEKLKEYMNWCILNAQLNVIAGTPMQTATQSMLDKMSMAQYGMVWR